MIPVNQQEWLHSVVLGAAQSLVVELGAPRSGKTILYASQFNKLTWAIVTASAATFSVEGSLLNSFASFDTLYTVGVLAAVLNTPYNLPAPQNQLGYVVINRPFIRLRLLDTSGGVHASTRFYAKAWE